MRSLEDIVRTMKQLCFALVFFIFNLIVTSCYYVTSSYTCLRSSPSTCLKSTSSSSSPPPSLEKPILQVARSSLRYLNLHVINALAILLRQLLKWNLKRYKRFDVTRSSFDTNIDIIEYIPQNQSKNVSNDCIIYINGGGFSLCDSADLLLSECLLPLIHERQSVPLPIIYCIHYPTLKSTNDITNYDIVKKQIYESYNNIINKSNKKIICIMGDSAGGNLVLQLSSQIKSSPPKVVLISPWLNLFSQADSYNRYRDDDMLEPSWLDRSRDAYLGKKQSALIQKEYQRYQADLLADSIVKNTNIKAVVFDMDLTIVTKHSRGCLPRILLKSFINNTSNDFIYFARSLHRRGIKLAIATHSDSYEYNFIKSEDNFIIGDELVRAILESTVPEIVNEFHIVAYNPTLRNDQDVLNQNKKLHIRLISQHYGVEEKDCLLFDDDEGNVRNNGGAFSTVLVNWKKGFELRDVRSFLLSKEIKYDNTLLKGLSSIVGDVNPLLKSDEQIQDLKLKDMLIVLGEKELFYDDILEFVHRTGASFHIGPNDIHAFPILWQHPLLKTLLSLGLGATLHDYLLPHRRSKLVSTQGYESITKIADFIYNKIT